MFEPFVFFSAGTHLITEALIRSAFSLYLCFCLPSRLDVSLHLCLFPSVLFNSNIIQAVIALKCVESSQGLHIHPAKKKKTTKLKVLFRGAFTFIPIVPSSYNICSMAFYNNTHPHVCFLETTAGGENSSARLQRCRAKSDGRPRRSDDVAVQQLQISCAATKLAVSSLSVLKMTRVKICMCTEVGWNYFRHCNLCFVLGSFWVYFGNRCLN